MKKNPFMDDEKNQSTSSASITVPKKSSAHNYKNNDEDDDGYDEDGTDPVNDSMTASYSEIAFHSNFPEGDRLCEDNNELKHDSGNH